MNLPYSPNTAYAPNQPIKSVDLNAFQACIVGKKHGPITQWFAPTLVIPAGVAGGATNLTQHQGKITANANVASMFGYPLQGDCAAEGSLIHGISMFCKGTGGAGVIDFVLEIWNGDGTVGGFTLASAGSPPAVVTRYDNTLAVGARIPMTAGMALVGNFLLALNTQELYTVGVTFSRP